MADDVVARALLGPPEVTPFNRRLGNVRLRNALGGDPSWNIFGLPYQGRKTAEVGQEMKDQMLMAEEIAKLFQSGGQ